MIRLKRLLATTDFSAGGNRALERAARLASLHGSDLEFMHVVDRRPIQTLIRYAAELAEISEDDFLAAANRELTKLSEQISKRHGVKVKVHAVKGVPYREILSRAAEISADLVVIGAHGENFINRVFVGTTMQRVARASKGSVLIVRNIASRAYERVMLPVDLTPDSDAVFRMADKVVPGAAVYVLHAYESLFENKASFAGASAEAIAQYRRAIESDIRLEMDKLIRRAGQKDVRVSMMIRRGYVPAVIEQAAQELNVDLIVMNAGGKTELSRFFLGSVSLHVMLEVNTDLLLMRESTSDH